LLVCNWPHFVGQNHFFVIMLSNRDSAIQSASKRFCTVYKSGKFCSLPAVWMTWHTVRTPNCPKYHPSGPSTVLRSFELFQLASVRIFQQYVWTPLGVQLAMEFPSKTQLWEDRCNRPDDVESRPDALILKASIAFKSRLPDTRALDMEITCIRSTVWTTIPLVQTREALIWKLLAAEVQPSGRQGTTVWTWLKTGRNFSEIFRKPIG
jgi:hypothetical protein